LPKPGNALPSRPFSRTPTQAQIPPNHVMPGTHHRWWCTNHCARATLPNKLICCSAGLDALTTPETTCQHGLGVS
jgi:hypothetical protein